MLLILINIILIFLLIYHALTIILGSSLSSFHSTGSGCIPSPIFHSESRSALFTAAVAKNAPFGVLALNIHLSGSFSLSSSR